MFSVPLVASSTLSTPSPVPRVAVRTAAHARPTPLPEAALLSPRARRYAVGLLRLRLLEVRKADLERVRAVIERRLGVDTLLEGETPHTNAR